MKVSTLIAILKDFDPKDDVILSNDPEGNEYRTVDFVTSEIQETDDGDTKFVIIYPTDDIIEL